jgi:hypothetical protein
MAETQRLLAEAISAENEAAVAAASAAIPMAVPPAHADDRIAALAQRLDALHQCALPGVVRPPSISSAILAHERLRLVATAVSAAERSVGQVEAAVVLAAPIGGGAARAVRLLRVGSGAWWLSLDGKEAGSARADGRGGVIIDPAVNDEAVRRRIAMALAIAEGRAPGELLELPAPTIPATEGTP